MTFCGLDSLGAICIGMAAPSLDDVAGGKGVLKRGMEGAAVRYVQDHIGVDSDGDFGPATEAAVKQFQKAKGLKVDGEVGKETMAAIDAMLMTGEKFRPTVEPAKAPSATTGKNAFEAARSNRATSSGE